MKADIRNLIGGLAGAIILNLIHESVKRLHPNAPRVDLVGKEALTKSLDAVGVKPPVGRVLTGTTLAADIVSNAMYFSMIGKGDEKRLLMRGAGYGLAAGFGAIGLTQSLGLIDKPVTKTNETKLMTVTWYLLGGISAALVMKKLGTVNVAWF